MDDSNKNQYILENQYFIDVLEKEKEVGLKLDEISTSVHNLVQELTKVIEAQTTIRDHLMKIIVADSEKNSDKK